MAVQNIRFQFTAATRQMEASLRKLRGDLGKVDDEFDEITESTKEADRAASQYGQALSRSGDVAELGRAKQELDGIGESLGALPGQAGQLGSALSALTGPAGLAAAAITGIGVAAASALNRGVDAFRQLQREIQGFTGLQGDDLLNVTAQVRTLEQTFGIGAEQLTLAARNLAASQGVSIQRALDLVQQGVTRGLNEEGLRQIEEYSTFLQQVGFDAEEAISFIQQSNQAGFFDDKAVDALKEASISLGELTQASRDALQPLGEEFANNLFESLNDPQAQVSLFDAIQQVSQRAFEQGLNRQEISTLIADVFRGAGEDAGGERVLQFFAELDRASLNLRGELTALQQQQQNNAQVNQQISESYARISEALLGSGGSVETLSLQFQAFALSIAEDLLPVIQDALGFLSSLFEQFLAFGNFLRSSRIGALIKDIAVAIGAYVAATKAAALATRLFSAASTRLKAGFTGLRGTVRNAGAAVRSFNKALASNAIGLAAAAIALLVQNWDDLTRAITGAVNAQREFNQQQSNLRAEVVENEAAIQKQVAVVQDGQVSLEDRQRALNQLIEQSPEIVTQLAQQDVNVRGAQVGRDNEVIDRFLTEVSNFSNELAQNRAVEAAETRDPTESFAFQRLLELGLAEGATEADLQREISALAEAQNLLARQDRAGNEAAVEAQRDTIDEIQERIDDLIAGESDILFGLLQSSGAEDFNIEQIVRQIARNEAARDLGRATIQLQEPRSGGGGRPLAPSGGRGDAAAAQAQAELDQLEAAEIQLRADLEPFRQAVREARQEVRDLQADDELTELEFRFTLDQETARLRQNASLSQQEVIRRELELEEQRTEIRLQQEERRSEEEARIRLREQQDFLRRGFVEERQQLEERLEQTDASETRAREIINAKLAELNERYYGETARLESAFQDELSAEALAAAERRNQEELRLTQERALAAARIAQAEQERLRQISLDIAEERVNLIESLFGDSEIFDRQREIAVEANNRRLEEVSEVYEEEVNRLGESEAVKQGITERFNAQRLNLELQLNEELAAIDQRAQERAIERRAEYYDQLLEATDEYRNSLQTLEQIADDFINNSDFTNTGGQVLANNFVAGFREGMSAIPDIIQTALESLQRLEALQGEIDILGATLEKLRRDREILSAEIERINAEIASIDQSETGVAVDPNKQEELDRLNTELERTEDAAGKADEEIDKAAEALNDLEAEEGGERLRAALALIEQVSTAFIGALQAASEAQQQQIEAQLDRQTQRVDEVRDALEQGGEAARNYSVEQLEAEEERQQRLQQLQREEIQRQQNLAAVQLAIQGAIAVAKALSAAPPPLNFILAAATAAGFVAQIAAIQQQARSLVPTAREGGRVIEGGLLRPGKAGGGTLEGRRHSSGGVLIEAEAGETIFSREQSKEFQPLFADILNGKTRTLTDVLRETEPVTPYLVEHIDTIERVNAEQSNAGNVALSREMRSMKRELQLLNETMANVARQGRNTFKLDEDLLAYRQKSIQQRDEKIRKGGKNKNK